MSRSPIQPCGFARGKEILIMRRLSTGRRLTLFARDTTNKRALVSFPDFTAYFASPAEFFNPQDHIYLSRYTPPRTFGVMFTVRY
jgi:hypothetical protein